MRYKPSLYDSDPRNFLKEEVSFYVKLIRKYKPKKILELGVGTGRIFKELLDLVNFGVGIDNSEEMISVCEKRCLGHNNYELINDNFVSFKLKSSFDFIYLPFNTFQHVLYKNDQVKCLKNIRKHLNRGGVFILDVMNKQNIELKVNEWKKDYTARLENGNILERFQNTLKINEDDIIHKQFKYVEYDDTGNVLNEETFNALMKINSNDEIESLVKDCGFEIKDMWTDYQFGRSDDTKKVIYCLKKNENN